ncbi:MAG: AlpA family phage regulatory protein [Acidobacteria bacterium]|nr:AlpA family phage regulatory protein [Acidobacteriota bacterium]
MATLEEQFNIRLNAFLALTGMSPTTLGMLAVGDPNLLRQIERGRSPSLRTADRVLEFISACELDSGGARAPPRQRGRARPATRARKARRGGAMTKNASDKRTKRATRLLRVSEVQARTSLGRSTIYRWAAEGRFPAPIWLSERVVRWIEAEVDEWVRKRLEKSRGGDASAIRN